MYSIRVKLACIAAAGTFLAAAPAAPAADKFRRAEHPFMLWTKEEAATIRHTIETEPWAKARYEAMLAEKGLGGTFRNLFRYLVMGDEGIVEAERKYLVSLIGNDPRKFLGDTGGGRHYDQYLSVLRYDALYSRLADSEREGLENTFRDFIRHHCEEETLRFTRTSWLPNMQWPRPITAHLMAVALRDEKLIRTCFESRGGWKFYFDDYLADGRFYGEEFGKLYSMVGEMFLWCRGVERLGLDGLGFGYVGKNGATMRRYVESIVEIGYPRVEIPGGLAHYPQVTMGDARGSGFKEAPPYLFQKSIVVGRLANGAGGNPVWIAANMNGRDHKNAKVDKMLHPHWFELAHAKWPDGCFDYFLAQMRKPGDPTYTPSLFWGIRPIESARVTPPSAPSFVARERGFAVLRAEESPSYWEGPAPAVAFQLATYYVHYTHDAFSLLGFHAFNRPIYLNRQISNGYGGGCLWTDSAIGHCGVAVDRLQYALDDANSKNDHPHWPNPVGQIPVRSGFDRHVKFVAARGRPVGGSVSLESRQPLAVQTLSLDLRRDEPEIWPGVDMTRALFLTREYLFDIFRLSSNQPRLWQWAVHAVGVERLTADGWSPNKDLLEEIYELANRQVTKRLEDPIERERYRIREVRKLDAGDAPWFLDVVQTCALPEIETSVLGNAWYDRKVGICVRMLGEAGTTVYTGRTPVSRQAPGLEGNKGESSELPNEVGGTTIIAERTKSATAFIALHEPFEGGEAKIAEFRRIAETAEGVAVAIRGRPGSSIDDRLLFQYDEAGGTTLTFGGGGETFTFSDRVYIRIGKDQVAACGGLRAMRVRVEGTPRLILDGREQPAALEDGFLVFGRE